jgi:signal transduction histidine kinase
VCAAIATLLLWWGVFARGLIRDHTALAVASARTPSEEVAASEKGSRQLLMIAGEGGLFGALLVVCVAGLFAVSVRRREDQRRMERLLQFTTHELKTPIAGVRALLQSMQLGSIPEEARAGFLSQGLSEMNRLEHLAETILAYQRASTEAERAPSRTAVRALVDDILAHRKRTFGDEQLREGARVDADVLVDPDAFRVVLENLLDNARKYGNGAATLEERVNNGRYQLSVTDQGMGFDPGDADRLFDPFKRADGGAAIHGSGLGLFISQQLVRQMNGELTASSAGKGQGAAFTIELPLAEGPDVR